MTEKVTYRKKKKRPVIQNSGKQSKQAHKTKIKIEALVILSVTS